MSGNILFLDNKIFQIPPFFQTRPGDLGKKVHACSLRFSALKICAAVQFSRVYFRWIGALPASFMGKKGNRTKTPWHPSRSCIQTTTNHQSIPAPDGFTPAVHHKKAQECRKCRTGFIRRTKINSF